MHHAHSISPPVQSTSPVQQFSLLVQSTSPVHHSRSASDNIRTIIEKTESVYVQKFQRGTLCSGKFSKSLANEQEAVGAYFASGFIDQ